MTELPEGWELKRLGDCLEKLKSGKKAERGWSPQCLSHPSRDENIWGVLKTTSVQMGEFQPEYNKELPEFLEPKVGLEVNPGDFLVTTTGPRNRCGIVCHVEKTRKKLIFSGKILRFRANEEIVLANWLLFLLMSPDYQKTLDILKVGTSDSSVSIGNQQVLDLEIPVPPLSEQQKILEILEERLLRLGRAIQDVKTAKLKATEFRRSILQAAFTGNLENHGVHLINELPKGWSYAALSDVCSLITDGSHFSPSTVDVGFPYITVRDLDEVGIDFKNCKFISQESFDELEKNGCKPLVGDILFSKDGTVGKVAQVMDETKFVVLSSLAILRPNRELITSKFLKHALTSPVLLESALGMKTGTALRRVVLRNLKTLQIPIPPIVEQQRIVEILDDHLSRLDVFVVLADSLEKQSDGLSRALLKAAFSGQLTKEVVSV